jgi:1-acyl-sn-glycerol-3-phosphate acyltransferase
MRLAKFIFYTIFGWKISGDFDPNLKKAVIIVAPHTSWVDFFIGLFVRKILHIEINFVGKKELFKPPFGWIFRWLGGAPLDRSGGKNKVEAIASVFSQKDTFRLAMAPEGTRKKVKEWRTGFYYIALKANVPIVPVSFDFKTKTVTLGDPFYPTGDIEKDMLIIKSFYKGVVGKVEKYT